MNRMDSSEKQMRIPTMLVLLLMVLIAFMLLYGFIGTPTSMDGSNNDSDLSGSADISGGHPSIPEPVFHQEPEDDQEDDGYISIRMEPSDISRGYLILINHDHSYEIPDDPDLVYIADEKTTSYMVSDDNLLISRSVIGPLNEMMDAFYTETGRDTVAVISAFRSPERQQEILDRYIAQLGRAEALRWAAIPGHSEHHTGLAIDFGFYSYGVFRTFLGTGTNAWFSRNSYNFGFILRYPYEKSEITQTAYEPWHFRFVGKPHAYIMFRNDWSLEEYIEIIMERTREEPFRAVFNEETFEIFFTRDTEIMVTHDCEVDISGNNIDGFIVTIRR